MSRRGWVIGAAVAVLVLIAYVLVVRLYDVEGGLTFTGPDSDGRGITVTVEPISVDTQRPSAVLHFAFSSEDDTVVDPSTQRLLANTRILITSPSGTEEFRYAAGTPLGQQDVEVGVDGEAALYPFDSHRTDMLVMADTYERGADSSFTSTGAIATTIDLPPATSTSALGVNGWDTAMVAGETAVSSDLSVVFQRAFSTQVFALVLLLLVIVLSGIALIVGLLTVTKRRRVEVGLMTYAGALLFALPALRQYMPNAPPVGASIDIYVYLWVIVAAIAAITLIVVSWISQTREVLLLERAQAAQAEAEPRPGTDAIGD